MTKKLKLAAVAALALGAPLEGGHYGGITTLPGGALVGLVYVETSDPGMTQQQCIEYAKERDGVLTSRALFHTLRATVGNLLPKTGWCHTSDLLSDDTGNPADASCAWNCNLFNGYTYYSGTSARGRAVVVRVIHLEV